MRPFRGARCDKVKMKGGYSNMKKMLSILLALVLVMGFASTAFAADRVGVAMPTQSLQRWNQDGDNMKKLLEAAGYEVDLQFANNDPQLQVSQLEQMLLGGAKVLVVASIDGLTLGGVLAQAKDAGVPVIAYDRLIMQSDAVSYYATFDNYKVGTIQGQYVEEKLGLKDGAGPFNVEFTGGSPDDNNALYFFGGAYDVLKGYIEGGQLVVPSGQTEFAQIATPGWDAAVSQARMDNILTANYSTGTKLDAVVCSNDSTAMGVSNALTNAGFEEFPIITGQDCDVANMKNILAGKQSMSIFKDTRTLAEKVVGMVDAILKGTEPEINDTTTYDNGTGYIVPTYLCDPVFADLSNYEELLIESGYYTAAELTVE